MFVNDKYFSFPPFLSTSWEHVLSLNLEEENLVVILSTGKDIKIPNLTKEELETIFKAHGYYLEREIQRKRKSELESKHHTNSPFFNPSPGNNEIPLLRFGMGATDGFGTALQHNPSQANAPEIPSEILEKISGIAKVLAPEDLNLLPTPEDNCNCYHCQIARSIRSSFKHPEEEEILPEELVTDEDLTFQEWDITQAGDKLFTVTNKLSPEEKYNVYLGHPVGCTCGKTGCEHIHVVLKS
ncbi:Uncharacterized protein PHSC3_000014 [Chlamydiales bacterium STE3]|nr:Uncharacterized protein PHSC3_000014 [Chlamydiales bacterium STE3]